jgi:hypothetical protein
MTDPPANHPDRTRRDARLTVDVSLSADYVRGTVQGEDGTVTDFNGWLGLAQAVAGAAGELGRKAATGPALLDQNTRHPRKDTR